MSLGKHFTQARSLAEYGNAGYVLGVVVLIPLTALLEWAAAELPPLNTQLPPVRESLRAAIVSIAPWLAPLIDVRGSVAALVFLLLVIAAFRKGFRIGFGVTFATAIFDLAERALATAEALVRRRVVVTALATALAVLLPVGLASERSSTRTHAAMELQFSSFERLFERFINRTTLSAQESDRAQRVLEAWSDEFVVVGLATPQMLAAVELLKRFYGNPTTEEWDGRVASILASPPVLADDSIADRWTAAARVLLGQANVRYAGNQNCASPEHIDRAAALFQQAKSAWPEASSYGLSLSYGCAFDYHVLGASPSALALCTSALPCARIALDLLVEGVSGSGAHANVCDDVELRRRAGKLALLVRLASNYSKLPPVWLSEARSPSQLAAQIDQANVALLQCSELAGLPDAIALKSVAEGYAARFSLLAAQPADPAGALDLALSSARWLIAAIRLAPPNVQRWWEFSRFCPIVRKQDDVASAFLEILGKDGASLCP